MTATEYVDLATAKAARGVRMVVAAVVPSPWSQAAKGVFRVQGVPVLAVRADPEDPEVAAWSRSHNVPSVLHDDDPPRTGFAEIVMLADRLGEPGRLLPVEGDRRARTMGLIHELAGERGLGWNARLLMIDAGLQSEGKRGFPRSVARYLAAKYGYSAGEVAGARERALGQLALLERELGGREYFGGQRPDALDVYAAGFLQMMDPIAEEDCPRMLPALRRAFLVGHEELGAAVRGGLVGHRVRMREWLGWPLEI